MSDWLIWQLADSGYPSGGFAHSGGLEAAWQSGEVPDDAALRQFVGGVVLQAGHALLPLASAAWRDPGRLEELDALSDAFLINAVANRASRAQGRAFLASCVRVYAADGELRIDAGRPRVPMLDLEARARALHAHYAPIAGAVFRALDVPLPTAQRLLLHVAARGVLAAAVRLGIVGPYRAQTMQWDAAAQLDAVLERCRHLDDREIAQTAPIADVLQGAHDRLYSRLFQS